MGNTNLITYFCGFHLIDIKSSGRTNFMLKSVKFIIGLEIVKLCRYINLKIFMVRIYYFVV